MRGEVYPCAVLANENCYKHQLRKQTNKKATRFRGWLLY
jgi:hypothetical protein